MTSETATSAQVHTENRESRVIKRHGWLTRVWHWVNVLCLLVLLMSGLQIFNAHPALYWGEQSTFDDPALQITAQRMEDGTSVGITRVGDLTFHTTGVLGLSRHEGKLDVRAFPDWITLPGPQWLAMGRNWHFTAAWIFAPLLLVYIAYTLISPRRRRLIFPTRRQWRALPRTIIEHARFRFEHRADYNGLQKLTYLVIIFLVLPLMVLTGLTMSPTMDSAWPWLLSIFGGRQSARTIHFIGAFTLVTFFLVHLAMVLISGFFNNMRSITSGGYRIHEPSGREDQTP